MGLAECLDSIVYGTEEVKSIDGLPSLRNGPKTLKVFEAWLPKGECSPLIIEQDLDASEALPWAKSIRVTGDPSLETEAGLKVLVVDGADSLDYVRNPNVESKLPLEPKFSAVKQVADEFGLTHAVWGFFDGLHAIPAVQSSSLMTVEPARCYRFSSVEFLLTWRWDPVSQTSVALLITIHGAPHRLKELILQSYELMELPLFPGILMVTRIVGNLNSDLFDSDNELGFVEEATGFTFIETSVQSRNVYSLKNGISTRELGRLSVYAASLAASSNNLVTNCLHIRSALQFSLEENKFFFDRRDSPKRKGYIVREARAAEELQSEQDSQTHNDKYRMCDEYLKTLYGFVGSVKTHAESIQFRATNQLSVLYNLIAQREQRLNMELAKASTTLAFESKRDSSSMKTLAAVTMIFLPGTFIASLFATPLFDWHADSSRNQPVVNDRIWVYFAFTVPITIVTMIVWYVWFRVSASRHDQGLSDTLQEIEGDSDSSVGNDSEDEEDEEQEEASAPGSNGNNHHGGAEEAKKLRTLDFLKKIKRKRNKEPISVERQNSSPEPLRDRKSNQRAGMLSLNRRTTQQMRERDIP